jgi:hypothetical protein
MSQVIQLDSILSQVENTQVQTYSSNTITETSDELDYAIDAQLAFGTFVLSPVISVNAVESSLAFTNDNQLNLKIYTNTVDSSLLFGDLIQLNMEIDSVPFPAIESTAVIPSPIMAFKVAPLSIATTVNFGTSSFIDNIHRLLVFKDDNISKIGENDAAVIAGGIRMNPASTTSAEASAGQASLPEAPAGFLSINIDGVDYKVPYYNS